MAKAEGYELEDDELEKISGGGFWSEDCYCPKCGSHDVGVWKELDDGHCYSIVERKRQSEHIAQAPVGHNVELEVDGRCER